MIKNLQALYKADFKHLAEAVIRDFEATEEIQQLRRDIKTHIPGSNWTIIRLELLIEMQKLLDIELLPILIDSWKTHQDVIREIEAQEKSSDDTPPQKAIVCLNDHEIRSSHSPSLDITIEEKVLPIRTFIGMTLELSDVSLLIQQGEIKEILSGTVKGKGFMQYQNATLIEKDFLAFDITGGTTQELPLENNQQEHKSSPQTPQSTRPQPAHKSPSASSNMLQFIVGISIALVAVYLFWQFK